MFASNRFKKFYGNGYWWRSVVLALSEAWLDLLWFDVYIFYFAIKLHVFIVIFYKESHVMYIHIDLLFF